MPGIIKRVAGHNRTSMQIAREHKRVRDNPCHDCSCLWLALLQQGLRVLGSEVSPLRREVSVEVNFVEVLPPMARGVIALTLLRREQTRIIFLQYIQIQYFLKGKVFTYQ